MSLPLGNVLQPLIDVFRAVLVFFHDTVGLGWGLSIVAMTILIRACLIPLTLRQFRSMQELSRHQPEIKKMQEKYKDDKQRLNQEMMGFYKEHKINPLASCLPLLAQMPVFISLFYMLRKDLRHEICPDINPTIHGSVPCGPHNGAGFLFIPDLTNKATGAVLITLMVLYVGSQLASSLLMSVSQDKMQRNLMLFLPLIFVTFVISFPAGLIVYWITTNLWTIVQQYIVRKRVGPIRPMDTSAGGSGAGGLLDRLRAGPAGPTPALAADGGSAAGRGSDTGAKPSRAPGAKPPPPPRARKKKRSGRRR